MRYHAPVETGYVGVFDELESPKPTLSVVECQEKLLASLDLWVQINGLQGRWNLPVSY